MIGDILIEIWLKPNEASVYLALLRVGTTHAGRLVIETKLPKATVYDTLESLEKKWLIHSYIHTKTTKYTAEDPQVLEHIVEREIKTAKNKQQKIASIIPELYGVRNDHFQIPKIRLYQGLEGISVMLEDSLQSTETIRTIVNVENMRKYLDTVNEVYAKKRVKKGVKKMALVEDTPWCREFLKGYIATPVSEIRFLPKHFWMFPIEMNIYDNKVVYITQRDKEPIGVILEDADIYQAQKALFDSLWNLQK